MTNDKSEEPLATGTWFYADAVECRIHIVRRNIAYGSGDHLDPVEDREDREGEFYYLKFSDPAKPDVFCRESGAFDSIEQAKADAKRTCPRLVWKTA